MSRVLFWFLACPWCCAAVSGFAAGSRYACFFSSGRRKRDEVCGLEKQKPDWTPPSMPSGVVMVSTNRIGYAVYACQTSSLVRSGDHVNVERVG